jgi:hypothetical protein
MTERRKISGADLGPGMTIKANRRIYKIREIEEPDEIGARLTDVELTSGVFATLDLFSDSEYELRGMPPRHRIVRVRAADLDQLLRVASYDVHVSATGDAVARLRDAMTEGTA